MALPVGTLEHAEVVPRYDENPLHHLGKAADSPRRPVAMFRLLPSRLAGTLLDRRDTHGVLPAPAVLRQ